MCHHLLITDNKLLYTILLTLYANNNAIIISIIQIPIPSSINDLGDLLARFCVTGVIVTKLSFS
jgi:hypothetical protein